jgi:DNA polymerase-3 subunit epsilon
VRILHPAKDKTDWPRIEEEAERNSGMRRICVLDTETTGLDPVRHQVIEICAALIHLDGAGRIVGLHSIGSALQDPGHPLPEAVAELTGLDDATLKGRGINREKLTEFISSCQGVIAFNASFDRPFIENLLPNLPRMPWGCAMKDVPWRKLGFEPGPQNYLLMQGGYYPPLAHRAQEDVLSLLQLLAHECADGESVMAKLLSVMTAPAWRFEATGAPYRAKDALKDRGYRFRKQGQGALWHKQVRAGEYDAELAWYRETVKMEPSIAPLPATERYRAEYTWQPMPPEGGWPRWLS